ncbi:hypothetical protein B0H11DRAFT_2254570 [Mycena galericulata]|nr:hypothetical protein B0H11DRAFT_2254570 [Mycena galericulata]
MLLILTLLTSVTLVNGASTVRLRNTTLVGPDIAPFKGDFFGGIPFAEPPLGNLKLRRPVLKASLEEGFPTRGSSARHDIGGLFNDTNVLRPIGNPAEAKLLVVFWA